MAGEDHTSDTVGPESRPVGVYADFVASIRLIERTDMALVVALGAIEPEREVLVPIVEWQLTKEEPAEGEQAPLAPTTTCYYLPLENALYVTETMCRDLARVSSQLAAIASGALKPAPGSIETYDEYLAAAQDALQECRDRLKTIG